MAKWEGEQDVLRNMEAFGRRVEAAVLAIAEYFAPIIESKAKENASWIDRTGNARAALHTVVIEMARGVVALYLYGGMDYNVWLELRWAGRYAIILPTMEAHYAPISKMLRETFS